MFVGHVHACSRSVRHAATITAAGPEAGSSDAWFMANDCTSSSHRLVTDVLGMLSNTTEPAAGDGCR